MILRPTRGLYRGLRDVGYLPFYFQGYGIFDLLLAGIWDIVYIFRDTASNKSKQIQSENVLWLLVHRWIWAFCSNIDLCGGHLHFLRGFL